MQRKYTNYVLLTLAALCSLISTTFSQEKGTPGELYLAAGIPDSLKENANSVVRFSETNMNVIAPDKITVKFHQIITVLNEKGDNHAVLQLVYNKSYDTYRQIEIRVYDAYGSVVKKYRKADMYDGAALNNMQIVTDDRILGLKPVITSYPSTVETTFEEDITSSLNLGRWDIQHDQQSVLYAGYHVSIDADAGFRYLNKNIAIKPQKEVIDGKDSYNWEVKNLKAIRLEDHAEPWRVFPAVYFCARRFEYYNKPGDFSSWQNFGRWIDTLNSDGALLTPARDGEIRKMTDSIKTDKEKARFLYNYLQQNMRYVNINLGIGGLKPLPATFVDLKKYGDCKALSNYMYALLNAIGVKAYYAIINAGSNKEPADPSFPFDYFNHVILCVPFKGDTTWLECTSATTPFGKLGPFTENRRALIITEDGGKLVNTPRSTMDDNQFNSKVHIQLDADGAAKATVKIAVTGIYREDCIGISSLQEDKQKDIFMNMLHIKQPITFDINPVSDKDGTKEMDLSLDYDNFCDVTAGDKQFYRSNVIDLVAFTVTANAQRKSDYYFESPMQKSCVTTIDLPQGFEVETLPINQSLKFTYGNYDIKFAYDAAKNQVISTAKFSLTSHVIPAGKYTEMQQYLDAVAKAQNKKLVIHRKA